MSRHFVLPSLLGLALAWVSPACDCSPSAGSPPCAAKRNAAVFAGVVTYASLTLEEQQAQSISPKNAFQMSRFTIEEDFSGIGTVEITLRTPGSSAACGYIFQRGRRYLVFATKTEQPNVWTTSICSRTSRLGSQRADLDLSYLRNLRKPGDHAVVWGIAHYGSQGLYDSPAVGIRVSLLTQCGIKEVLTDLNGVFEFTELARGRYSLGLPTFPDYSREIETKANGCEAVNFPLPIQQRR
jgi:hypothetical protein